ncbi:hypothetical protein HYH02_014628 [Chlamydomonas schloesseri]|uniref:RAP domain-containing protein n=1 Tax=Chlamydomonas schloesseri TaxID=2026947 RepID=A0A835SHE2_9CHLO|nr:hypothetical protein HYH02_014628 [Chlamydomonas schloesseri]|eukprot:KAG2427223.1 hypothetical protein HYH02_014628 [Chlamydomonas schloesseri]
MLARLSRALIPMQGAHGLLSLASAGSAGSRLLGFEASEHVAAGGDGGAEQRTSSSGSRPFSNHGGSRSGTCSGVALPPPPRLPPWQGPYPVLAPVSASTAATMSSLWLARAGLSSSAAVRPHAPDGRQQQPARRDGGSSSSSSSSSSSIWRRRGSSAGGNRDINSGNGAERRARGREDDAVVRRGRGRGGRGRGGGGRGGVVLGFDDRQNNIRTGSSNGGSRPDRPPEYMAQYRTLEALGVALELLLPQLQRERDTTTLAAAFHKAVLLSLGDPVAADAGVRAAATAKARAAITTRLVAAYAPLVPHVTKAEHCSIPLWALAKAGAGGWGGGAEGEAAQQLAAALLAKLVQPGVLATASSQNMANALYALGLIREDRQRQGGGAAGWDPAALKDLAALARAVASRLTAAAGGPHSFEPQHLSNMLWGCAKLGWRDAEDVALLQSLAPAAAVAAPDMTPQQLSNSLWALAEVGCSRPEYKSAVKGLCREALRRLQTLQLAAAFKPQGLSNILLALEGLQLGSEQAALVAAVAAECELRHFAGFVPQHISNTAWALAKLEYGVGPEAPAEQQHFYASAVDAVMRPEVMAGATPQHWSNLLYALALVRHQPPPELLDAGAAAAELRQGNSQECANVLLALAVLRLRHVGLKAAVCGRLGELQKSNPGRVSTQHVANSLWALAVFGDLDAAAAALAVQLAHEAVGRPLHSFIPEQLCQLWQAQQELGGEVAAALGSSPCLQAAMAAAVEAKWAESTKRSGQQKQVAAALRRLQQQGRLPNLASVQEEVVVPGVLGPSDIVLRWEHDGQQQAEVAVEFDGPTHYLANRPHDPSAVDGRTALRNRQLVRAFGEGRVLCVPYWEWDELYGAQQQSQRQEAYLLRRLQPLLLLQPELQPLPQQAEPLPAAEGHGAGVGEDGSCGDEDGCVHKAPTVGATEAAAALDHHGDVSPTTAAAAAEATPFLLLQPPMPATAAPDVAVGTTPSPKQPPLLPELLCGGGSGCQQLAHLQPQEAEPGPQHRAAHQAAQGSSVAAAATRFGGSGAVGGKQPAGPVGSGALNEEGKQQQQQGQQQQREGKQRRGRRSSSSASGAKQYGGVGADAGAGAGAGSPAKRRQLAAAGCEA